MVRKFAFFICCVSVLLLSHPARAQLTSLVAQNLVAEGKNYYASGDYAKAIHEFSKALLADPNNEEAQHYLNGMGMDVGLLIGQNKTKLYHLSKIAKNIDWYKMEMSKLEQDNAEKERLAELLKKEKQRLAEALANKEAENVALKEQVGEVVSTVKTLEKDTVKKEKEISCLNDELCALEETLVTKVALLEEKELRIKDLDRDVRLTRKEAKQRAAQDRAMIKGIESHAQRKEKQVARLSMDVAKLKETVSDRDSVLEEREARLKELTAEIRDMERDLRETEQHWQAVQLDYEKKLQDRDGQVEQVQERHAQAEQAYQQKVAGLQKSLQEKRLELNEKNNKLIATDYKLQLTQRALAAKNKMIEHLRKSMLSLDKEMQEVQNRNHKEEQAQLAKTGQQSVQDKQRLKYIQRQDELIAGVKDKLAAARAEIYQLEKGATPGSIEKLLELKAQLTEVRIHLEDNSAVAGSMADTTTLLTQCLKDTERRLAQVVKMVTEKDVEITELEKQVADVLSQAGY